MINLTLSVSYKCLCLHFQDFNGGMCHEHYVTYCLLLISALRAFICNNTVCVLFIYFSLEAIVGLKSISGKSTIEQLLLYSN